jgi:hypothetical protein
LKRLVLALIVGATVFATAYAAAAGLGGLDSNDFGAGDATVASCDTNGIWTFPSQTTYNSSLGGFALTELQVGAISAGCVGGTIYITLADSGGASIGELTCGACATIVNDGGPPDIIMTFSVGATGQIDTGSGELLLSDVADIHVTIHK